MAKEKDSLEAYLRSVEEVQWALVSLRETIISLKKSAQRQRRQAPTETERAILSQKIERLNKRLLALQTEEQILLKKQDAIQRAHKILAEFPDSWWQKSALESLVRRQLKAASDFKKKAGELQRNYEIKRQRLEKTRLHRIRALRKKQARWLRQRHKLGRRR